MNLRACARLLLVCLTVWVSSRVVPARRAAAAPPGADEVEAAKQLRRVASNLQKNRDGTVRFVRLSKAIVQDQHLKPLAAFSKIDYLALLSPQVGDAGLAHIRGLTTLDTLLVGGNRVTDEGLAALSKLTRLERLYLERLPLTDAGLKRLPKAAGLQVLSLQDTAIRGPGLSRLREFPKLQSLRLSGTQITDDGLAHLAGLAQLETLRLDRTAIRGPGLKHLQGLKKLRTLDLSSTKLQASAIEPLGKLQQLKQLLLYHAPQPRAALQQLQAALGKTQIARTPVPDKGTTAFERFLARRKRTGDSGSATADTPATRKATEQPLQPPIRAAFAAKSGDKNRSPDFQRHVLPLLGRLGCNGRNCHGSFQGRGGFRLSMFGYDFAADAAALRERLDTEEPEGSLILRKPLRREEHEGGKRFSEEGWEHRLLRRWIKGGAKQASADRPRFVRLEVRPEEIVFQKIGERVQLKTVAVWSDGTREDVTCLTRFESKDDTRATVTPEGQVESRTPGDTHIIALYDNGVAATQTLLPVSPLVGSRFPAVQTPTEIDRLVVAKLAKLGIKPAPVCSDAEFLRRVSLDIAGTLPTPDEVQQFLEDPSPDKRARTIDRLIGSPEYVEWWTNLLCDLTGSNAQFLGSTDMNQPAAVQWRNWIRRRVRDNVGWDELVAGILLAISRRPGQTYDQYVQEHSGYQRRKQPDDFTARENPMHYYWFRSNLTSNTDRALSFGYVFLGVRLQCAQCHKHPYDRWSKQDFEQFTRFFARIRRGAAPDALPAQQALKNRLGVPKKLNTAALRRQMYMRVAAEGLPIPWNEIYIAPPTSGRQPAKLLGGREIDLNAYDDPREPLMEWLTREDNPYFARAIVNRIWAHYFHAGIVEPPDDFNQANPPSNKPLLDYLTAEFVRRGYDLAWLHRTITLSDTYQRSRQTNDTNRKDQRNFSRMIVRRLPAEVAIDAVLQATASQTALAQRARLLPQRKIAQHPKSIQARGVDYALLVFGKPLRMTNCDCERQRQPTLLQSLYLRNDREMLERLERPDGWLVQVARQLKQPLARETKPAPSARRVGKKKQAAKKATAKKAAPIDAPDDETVKRLIEQAYLRSLCRLPTHDERRRAARHLATAENTVEGLRDLLWALLNTREFLTNH